MQQRLAAGDVAFQLFLGDFTLNQRIDALAITPNVSISTWENHCVDFPEHVI